MQNNIIKIRVATNNAEKRKAIENLMNQKFGFQNKIIYELVVWLIKKKEREQKSQIEAIATDLTDGKWQQGWLGWTRAQVPGEPCHRAWFAPLTHLSSTPHSPALKPQALAKGTLKTLKTAQDLMQAKTCLVHRLKTLSFGMSLSLKLASESTPSLKQI